MVGSDSVQSPEAEMIPASPGVVAALRRGGRGDELSLRRAGNIAPSVPDVSLLPTRVDASRGDEENSMEVFRQRDRSM